MTSLQAMPEDNVDSSGDPIPAVSTAAGPTASMPHDSRGFRLRGLEMTRIETFTDAAFAFALTLLVISLDPPTTMEALSGALKHVPGFMLSAILLMVFWNAHHRWSRRYGLDDGPSVVLSCLLVFTVLVFVYPLRYMANAWASFAASLMGLPIGPGLQEIGIIGVSDVNELFVIYGIGFMSMSLAIATLNWHAWRRRDALELSEVERVETRAELGIWCILFMAGFVSTLIAAAFPQAMPMAGYAYAPLGIVIPLYLRYVRRNIPDSSGGAIAS